MNAIWFEFQCFAEASTEGAVDEVKGDDEDEGEQQAVNDIRQDSRLSAHTAERDLIMDILQQARDLVRKSSTESRFVLVFAFRLHVIRQLEANRFSVSTAELHLVLYRADILIIYGTALKLFDKHGEVDHTDPAMVRMYRRVVEATTYREQATADESSTGGSRVRKLHPIHLMRIESGA